MAVAEVATGSELRAPTRDPERARVLGRLLQDAHAGELAAAFAYRAHARSLWRRPDQRAEVRRIEGTEWHHRALVAVMLRDLGLRPRRGREWLMGATGRFFGLLCFVTGWFGPMYAAGRLEAMNVDQYRAARDLAQDLGLAEQATQLEAMRVEEVRHERWFGDRVRGHRLLPLARFFLGWSPPPRPKRTIPHGMVRAMPTTVGDAGTVFVDPAAYADIDRFHQACTLLRREDPVHRVEQPGYPPFWAITRHADVYEVELHPQAFTNGPIPVLADQRTVDQQMTSGALLRTLIHMDDPDHKPHRALAMDWFKPRTLARLESRLAELARLSVQRMVELDGRCDFARDVAMQFPLQVILAILGLPESDYPRMLRLTQELFGAEDPELSRGKPEDVLLVMQDFFAYFMALTEDRRREPADDLASAIANGSIDGAPLGLAETISYYIIVATAGHDTTSSAMAGGLQALAERPDQLARLQQDPALLDTAVDEIIRWVTPVRHFMRTATEPYELGGHRFEPGDWLLLSYPSANRDETVFADPFTFDVARSPNPHLAFGFGAHYCLGAKLARMEIRALLAELVPRLRRLELAGEPALTSTTFVGGLKHLPLSYELA